jgi:hypothetical protein
MTPCTPCTLSLWQRCRSVASAQGNGPPGVTVTYPLDTAGDRCLWHAGGTADKNDDASAWRRRLQLGQTVRPVLGNHRLVAESPEARGSGWETPTLRPSGPQPESPSASSQLPELNSPTTCDASQPSLTVGDRRCPCRTVAARTPRGPSARIHQLRPWHHAVAVHRRVAAGLASRWWAIQDGTVEGPLGC